MILETLCVGPMQVNCYILASDPDSRAIIIDPGAEEGKIKKVLNKYNLKPEFIINTHGHIDHIGCDDKFDIPVYIHRQDFIKRPEIESL
jgi:glyoxylase-like metal-dependent hydrolase (beta-lactamase superfamily II)